MFGLDAVGFKFLCDFTKTIAAFAEFANQLDATLFYGVLCERFAIRGKVIAKRYLAAYTPPLLP